MKTKNKLVRILATVAMILPLFAGLAGGSQAFAAENETAPETQNVILHKRQFNPLTPEDTKKNTGDEMADFGGAPLEGAVFTAYDVTTTYWEAYDKASGDETAKQDAASKASKTLNGNETAVVFDATDNDGKANKQLPTTSNGKNAVYLFVETGFPAGTVQSKSAPFILGLPSVTDSNEYRTDVHVYPKNEVISKDLHFIKYGVNEAGEAAVLPGAKFKLKLVGADKYFGSDNNFSATEADAKLLESGSNGLVTTGDLALVPGTYEFYEVSTVDGYHFGKNPIVVAHVDNDLNVTYDYFDLDNKAANGSDAAAYNYQVPAPVKTPKDKDFDVNAPIEFTIEQAIPKDIADYTTFKLVDNYDKNLQLTSTEDEILATAVIKEDNTKIDNLTTYTAEDGVSFTLDFTNHIQNLAEYAGKTIQFKATMKIKAGAAIATPINNEITFDNNFEPKHDTADVKTYGKKFIKTDLATGEKLQGAEFVVLKAGKYLQYQDDKGNKVATYTSNGSTAKYAVAWVDSDAEATHFVSGEDGFFTVNGLAKTDSDKKDINYSLKETKAPEGYAELKAEIGFTADDGTKVLTVNNKHKGVLPSTGGMGIVAFVAVGIAAIGGAYLYFTKGRRHIEG